jgi:hypothetical protein
MHGGGTERLGSRVLRCGDVYQVAVATLMVK